MHDGRLLRLGVLGIGLCFAGVIDGIAAFILGPPSRMLLSFEEVVSVLSLWTANAMAMFCLFLFVAPPPRAALLAAIVGAGGAIGANLGLMLVALIRDALVAREHALDFDRLLEFVGASIVGAALGIILASWLGWTSVRGAKA